MYRPRTIDELAQAGMVDKQTFQNALAGFLDEFYRQEADRQTMIDADPRRTGNKTTDVYLAAIAEHLARRWGLKIPVWTFSNYRVLHRPVFATSMEALKPMLLKQSPLAFRKRLLFVEAEPLKRARMPRD